MWLCAIQKSDDKLNETLRLMKKFKKHIKYQVVALGAVCIIHSACDSADWKISNTNCRLCIHTWIYHQRDGRHESLSYTNEKTASVCMKKLKVVSWRKYNTWLFCHKSLRLYSVSVYLQRVSSTYLNCCLNDFIISSCIWILRTGQFVYAY